MSNPCDRCGMDTESSYIVLTDFFQGWLCDLCRSELREFVEEEPDRSVPE